MSGVTRVALAAVLSLTFASNAMAQKMKSHASKLKPFTVEEQLYFERASNPTSGASGGGEGGGPS
jgi:hypothetical protein